MQTNQLSSLNQAYVNRPVQKQDAALQETKTEPVKEDNKKIKTALTALAAIGVAAVAIGVGVRKHKLKQMPVGADTGAGDKAVETAKQAATEIKDAARAVEDNTQKIKEEAQELVQKQEEVKAAAEKIVSKNDPKTNRLLAIKKFHPNSDSSIKFYENRPGMLYRDAVWDYYDKIRHCSTPYALRNPDAVDISTVVSKGNSDIKVLDQNGWFYRMPLKRAKEPIVDRISLNVYPEEGLIEKLDAFVAKSSGGVEYKTPLNIDGWNKRHDPITIYFRKPVSAEIEKEITDIAGPYTRKTNTEVLFGRKIADSIYEVKEPDEKIVSELIERAKNLNFDDGLIKCLEDTNSLTGAQLFSINDEGKKFVHTSPGMVEAVKTMLDDIEKLIVSESK